MFTSGFATQVIATAGGATLVRLGTGPLRLDRHGRPPGRRGLAFWVLGQDLGQLYTDRATDPTPDRCSR